MEWWAIALLNVLLVVAVLVTTWWWVAVATGQMRGSTGDTPPPYKSVGWALVASVGALVWWIVR